MPRPLWGLRGSGVGNRENEGKQDFIGSVESAFSLLLLKK